MFTSDQIKKAVDAIRQIRPAYTEILDFYEQIFIAQENIREKIQISPIQIDEEALSIKSKEKMPLIDISEFIIDTELSSELFRTICDIAEKTNPVMSASVRNLIHGIDETRTIYLNQLFSALLNRNEDYFDTIAAERDIEKEVLSFLTYNSLNPFVRACAEQLSTYLDSNMKEWEKGYCPICGSMPVLSILADHSHLPESPEWKREGERFLFCSFCWHQWAMRRICCPFCENTDSKTLYYIYSKEEKENRVDVCDRCKKYIKTIDTRKMNRLFYPPLEQVATLHLDILAREKEEAISGGLKP